MSLQEARTLVQKAVSLIESEVNEVEKLKKQLKDDKVSLAIERASLEQKLMAKLGEEIVLFEAKKKEFEDMQQQLRTKYNDTSSIITLNVGGTLFTTLRTTLTKHPSSMLAAMFSGLHPITRTEQGHAFIDRNPKFFGMILEYLRTDEIPDCGPSDLRALRREMDYFGLVEAKCTKYVTLEVERVDLSLPGTPLFLPFNYYRGYHVKVTNSLFLVAVHFMAEIPKGAHVVVADNSGKVLAQKTVAPQISGQVWHKVTPTINDQEIFLKFTTTSFGVFVYAEGGSFSYVIGDPDWRDVSAGLQVQSSFSPTQFVHYRNKNSLQMKIEILNGNCH